MTKLRWDLHINTHKPWVNFHRQKYNYPVITTPRSNSSFIYMSIFKDKNIFKSNLSCTIKNGLTTNLWYDRQIHNQPLRSLLIDPFPMEEHFKHLSPILTYTNDNAHWNLDTIPFPIPTKITREIHNIPLLLSSSNSSVSKQWNLTNDGTFNLKSAYNFINKSKSITINLNWICHRQCNIRGENYM